MEEMKASKQNPQQEKSEEGNLDKQVEPDQAEKVIPMLEKNQSPEDTEKERNENEAEISVGSEGGKGAGEKTEPSKKSKEGSKRIVKPKFTVPQPFSLATEKRMSKERRRSVDFSAANEERMPKQKLGSLDSKAPQLGLSRSSSLTHKIQPSPGAAETKLRRTSSTHATTTNTKPKATASKRPDKGVENGSKSKEMQVKEVESKNLQVNTKKGEESETNKLVKIHTSKTTPSRNLQAQKDPPSKPGLKKNPVTRPKSFSLDLQSKSLSDSQSNRREDKGKTASKRISNSAKETISKILTNTRKILNPTKEKPKSDASNACRE